MAMAAFEWERGEATPEMLDFYRRHVGLEYECEGWITEASRDAIRHFAEGVGDDNPLYLDPSYAGASPYGGLITPPTFPDVFSNKGFTAEDGFHRGPLPGLFGLWAADRWEFHQPVRLGDTLRSIFRMDSIRERPSAFGGTAYEQVDRNTYYNQAGELVASYVILRFNYEREAARGRDKYGGMQPHRYTDAEIEAIEHGYEEERVRRRGAEPLYWEDVTEGAAVPPIIKGPLTLTQLIGFVLGWGSAYCQANRLAHQYGRGNPRAVLINREYNIKDNVEGAHWDVSLARQSGFPDAYDFGCMRTAWAAHLLTDWAGDHGRVHRLEVQIRRPNIIGDTQWFQGRVASKGRPDDASDSAAPVEVELWADNQRGETTTVGSATVLLPLKA